MAKSKVKQRIKTEARRRPKLSEINELAMSVFIIKREMESKLKERLQFHGAQILSIARGKGVSRNSILESFKVGSDDVSVFFTTSRIEDVRDLMEVITEEFELADPGNGKAFILDVDGYLGAKALFIE